MRIYFSIKKIVWIGIFLKFDCFSSATRNTRPSSPLKSWPRNWTTRKNPTEENPAEASSRKTDDSHGRPWKLPSRRRCELFNVSRCGVLCANNELSIHFPAHNRLYSVSQKSGENKSEKRVSDSMFEIKWRNCIAIWTNVSGIKIFVTIKNL